MLVLYICALVSGVQVLAAPTSQSVDLLMPSVQPQEPDTYLCRSFDVADLKHYITGFVPNANKDIAHHILLYGCDEPGSEEEIWNCGEMTSKSSHFRAAPVCASGPRILYAWAMDAPSLTLPKDVAFKIGGDSGINKLAMQVHYKNVTNFLPPLNGKDSSGLTLITTDEPKGRLAGVYLMVTGGVIPKGQTEYLEAACPFPNTEIEIHPFAFRTHTHTLGRVVSGYRIRDGEWVEIGRQDPRKPQMFYNATTPKLTVRRGDILAARCTMVNEQDHDVSVGSTQKDEMCNFYIMYYINSNRRLSSDTCFKPGAPVWYLRDFQNQQALNLKDMPESASVIPGTTEVLQATTHTDEKNEEERGLEEEEEEEEEEENPVMDELLDDFIAQMDPETLMMLTNEQEPRAPYYPQSHHQRRLSDMYGPRYYPDDLQ